MTDSLLWKINRDNFPPSFLFGTIHIYDSTVFRIPEMIYRLIDSVDIYLPESDTRRVPYGEIRNRMIVTDPDYSLKNFFDDKSYAEILSLSETETDILDKYKPFFVSSLMMTDENMPDDSVDFELLNYASSVGKTVCELESFEEQMNAIDNIPYREQAEIIERSMLS
ncbi:MAG: TraB/GumN family protein, partial [Prevotellaceae bacterium]|nr:TraB/GumN family protein [Prevotellaceae bacterium]